MTDDFQLEDVLLQNEERIVYRAQGPGGAACHVTRLKLPAEVLQKLSSTRFARSIVELKSLNVPGLRPVIEGGLDEDDQSPWVATLVWPGKTLAERLVAGVAGPEVAERLELGMRTIFQYLEEVSGTLSFDPQDICETTANDGKLIESFCINYHRWFVDWASGKKIGDQEQAEDALRNLLHLVNPTGEKPAPQVSVPEETAPAPSTSKLLLPNAPTQPPARLSGKSPVPNDGRVAPRLVVPEHVREPVSSSATPATPATPVTPTEGQPAVAQGPMVPLAPGTQPAPLGAPMVGAPPQASPVTPVLPPGPAVPMVQAQGASSGSTATPLPTLPVPATPPGVVVPTHPPVKEAPVPVNTTPVPVVTPAATPLPSGPLTPPPPASGPRPLVLNTGPPTLPPQSGLLTGATATPAPRPMMPLAHGAPPPAVASPPPASPVMLQGSAPSKKTPLILGCVLGGLGLLGGVMLLMMKDDSTPASQPVSEPPAERNTVSNQKLTSRVPDHPSPVTLPDSGQRDQVFTLSDEEELRKLDGKTAAFRGRVKQVRTHGKNTYLKFKLAQPQVAAAVERAGENESIDPEFLSGLDGQEVQVFGTVKIEGNRRLVFFFSQRDALTVTP